MRCKVYRSLDSPSSLLGMKGVYLVWLMVALGLSLLLAVLVGTLASSIFGTMLFLVLALVSYFLVLYVQSLYPVKDLPKLLCSFRLHRHIMTRPQNFSVLWNSVQDSDPGRK